MKKGMLLYGICAISQKFWVEKRLLERLTEKLYGVSIIASACLPFDIDNNLYIYYSKLF